MEVLSTCQAPFPLRALLCLWGFDAAQRELSPGRAWEPSKGHPARWELHHQHFPPCSSPGWAVLIAAGLCSVVGAFCWELLRQRSELLPLTGIRALFRLQEAKNPLEKPSGLHYLLKLEKQLARVINTWVASVNPAKAALLSQWLQAQINCFWDQEHIYKCDWSSWQC